VTRELQDRYRKCSRKEKTVLLNELIQLTDYNRSYAGRVLRRKEILGYLTIAGKRVKYVAASKKRKKSKYYDQEVLVALTQLWEEADSICSQRLAPFLAEFIPVLEKYGEIKVTKQVKEKLFTISAATIDRLLAPIRKKQQMKGNHHPTGQPVQEEHPHPYLQSMGGR